MHPILGLLAGAALLALPAVAAQAQTELRFGHVGGPSSLFQLSAQHFAEKANERLEGRYEVVVYHSSQLGSDSELLQRLRLGTVDFALPSTVMSSVSDEFGLFELPYLVRDREHMKRIEAEIFWPRLHGLLEAQNFRVLAVWENGFRHITNNIRPIVGPEDLSGVKLRTPSGAWRVRMFEAYGAHPSPMEYGEVFMALQTGVMDGQENPLTQIYSQKFQEVQKYLSLTGHVYTPAYLTAGASWARLSPEVQKILADTAVEVEPDILTLAGKLDEELIGKMKAAGIQVNQADKPAFVAASKDVYGEFAKEVPMGKDLIDKSLSLAKGT